MEDRWGRPISELEEMDSFTLSERMVYDNRIRASELDILAARLCHMMACVNTPKGSRRPSLEDFIPNHQRALSKVQSSGEVAARFIALYGKPRNVGSPPP